jgi:hypothetical protein
MKINKYWFKSKKFGWGFVPISWEGWITTLMLLVLVQLSAYLNNIFSDQITYKDTLSFLFDSILIILVTMPFFTNRCQDKPRWRWGK